MNKKPKQNIYFKNLIFLYDLLQISIANLNGKCDGTQKLPH